MSTLVAIAAVVGIVATLILVAIAVGHRRIRREVQPRGNELTGSIAKALADPFTRPLMEDAFQRCGLGVPEEKKELAALCAAIVTDSKFGSLRDRGRAGARLRILEEELELYASMTQEDREQMSSTDDLGGR